MPGSVTARRTPPPEASPLGRGTAALALAFAVALGPLLPTRPALAQAVGTPVVGTPAADAVAAAGSTPEARHPLLPIAALGAVIGRGDTVRVAGRATVSSGALQQRVLDVAVDDGTGAVRVFALEATPAVQEGDSVVATGIVQRYRGMAELLASEVSVVPGPSRLVTAIDLPRPRGAARFEGRLVRTRAVVRETGRSEGGRWFALAADPRGDVAEEESAEDSLALHHAESAGAARRGTLAELTLWIPAAHDDRAHFDDYEVGDRIDVTGIVAAFQDNPGDPVVWQVIPRSAEDVRVVGIPRRWYAAAARLALAAVLLALLALGIARALTRRSARALRETRARYAQLLALSPAPVLVHDGRQVLFANEAAARLFGAPKPRALAGRAVADFTHPDAPDALEVAMEGSSTARAEAATVRARVVAAGGCTVDVEVTKSACRYHDRPAAVVILRDIGDELHREAALREMAHVDELTGVANRRGFLARAEAALDHAQRGGRGATLVFADVDGLKRINDTHGHAAGDEAIRAVARALVRLAGPGNVVARWSGDEFVALLGDEPGTVYEEGAEADARRAATLTARFRLALAAEPVPAPVEAVSASLGACRIPAHQGACASDALSAALERADAGLYAQKGERQGLTVGG